MKKKLLSLILVLCAMSPLSAAHKKKVLKTTPNAPARTSAKVDAATAATKPKTNNSLQAWLKGLKQRLNRSETQSKQLVAVAAVRGAEQPDAPPLYWKGKSNEGRISGSEAKDFGVAIDSALGGDSAAAREKLNSFIAAYPHSPLVGEARETLSRLDSASVQP